MDKSKLNGAAPAPAAGAGPAAPAAAAAAPAEPRVIRLDLDGARIQHAARQRADGQLVADLVEAVFLLQDENARMAKELAELRKLNPKPKGKK